MTYLKQWLGFSTGWFVCKTCGLTSENPLELCRPEKQTF